MAFAECGIEIEFIGENINEIGVVKSCTNPSYSLEVGKVVVKVDPNYFRPTEVDLLIGDATKSKTVLGWIPKYDLKAIVQEMVESDIKLFTK
jgi:GDPmannose 4,6-dehydratase